MGRPPMLQHDQSRPPAGARQNVCFASANPTVRSGAASQCSPVARTISSPWRAPGPTGGAGGATPDDAVTSAVETSANAVGAEGGKSSSAPQTEKKTWEPNTRGRQAARPSRPASNANCVQAAPSSLDETRSVVRCSVGSLVSQKVAMTHSLPPKTKSLGCRGSRLATPMAAVFVQVCPLSSDRTMNTCALASPDQAEALRNAAKSALPNAMVSVPVL